MNFRLANFFSFRPELTTVKVLLYENGKEKHIYEYSNHHQYVLMKSIQALFPKQKTSQVWLEPEIHEVCGCFRRVPPILYVTCYQEDRTKTDFKRRANIPHRFRRILFDKVHILYPEPVGQTPWSSQITVKFVIAEKM